MKKQSITKMLSPDIISVHPDTLLEEAIRIITKRKISCIVAVENDKPVGILTERDIVVISFTKVLQGKETVRHHMTSPVVTACDDIDMYEAYHILSVNKIRHLLILDHNGSVRGIVTQSDLINGMGLDLSEVRKASQIMNKDIVALDVALSVMEAINVMKEQSISCVIAEQEGKAIGIITERDITKLLYQKIDFTKTTISEVMSHPLISSDENTPVQEIARLMKQHHIRRIILLDNHGKFCGMITQSDLIKGVLEGKYIESLQKLLQKKEEVIQEVERTLIEKTIFLDNILYSANELGILSFDCDLRVNFYNPAAEEIFGNKAKDVYGKRINELALMNNNVFKRLDLAIVEAREKGEYMDLIELSGEGKKVVGIKISVIKDLRDRKREVRGFFMMAKDITERRRDEDVLRVSEEKYRTIFQNSRDGVYITSLEGDILEINGAGADLFGYSQQELLSTNISSLYNAPEERKTFVELIQEEHYVKDYEIDFKTKRGEVISTLVTAATQKDHYGRIIGFQGIIRDVTARKKQDAVISYMAYHDALTGLPNRRTFIDRLSVEIAHARRHKSLGAVLFIDLDNFKKINDTYGHNTGDQLLIKVADRIEDVLRESDTVARLGGDEFTIILSEIAGPEDAQAVSEKLIERFHEPIKLDAAVITVSLSLGISIFPRDGLEPEDLLDKSDEAMYQVKQSGRNGTQMYVDTQEMSN